MSNANNGGRLIVIGIGLSLFGALAFDGITNSNDPTTTAMGVVYLTGSFGTLIFGIYRLLASKGEARGKLSPGADAPATNLPTGGTLKAGSGIRLMLIGIGLNLLGRLLFAGVVKSHDLALSALVAVWMVGSVVIFLFGLYRLIVSKWTASRRPAVPSASVSAVEQNHPPIPEPE